MSVTEAQTDFFEFHWIPEIIAPDFPVTRIWSAFHGYDKKAEAERDRLWKSHNAKSSKNISGTNT